MTNLFSIRYAQERVDIHDAIGGFQNRHLSEAYQAQVMTEDCYSRLHKFALQEY